MDDRKDFSSGENDTGRTQTIIIKSPKNVGLAAGLGFFLGPLGLCYSTFTGAIIMFIVNGIIGFVTFGFGLFLTWPVCAIWGYIAAKRYNDELYKGMV